MLHFLIIISFFLDNKTKSRFHKILKLNKRYRNPRKNYIVSRYDENLIFFKFLLHALNNQ